MGDNHQVVPRPLLTVELTARNYEDTLQVD
jgi:hypothetical protein